MPKSSSVKKMSSASRAEARMPVQGTEEGSAVYSARDLARLQSRQHIMAGRGTPSMPVPEPVQPVPGYADLINEVIMLRGLYTELDDKVTRMLSFMEEARSRQVQAREMAGMQSLVDVTPVRELDAVRARLARRGVEAVLSGTEWLTAAEVGALADAGAANPHAYASRLVKEGRVFAIERGGVRRYPHYAFDPLGNVLPVLREVLQVFAGWSAFRIASWFESASSALGGRRPRELLDSDPAAVIAAARSHLEGPLHG